jgi:hypothetical protein
MNRRAISLSVEFVTEIIVAVAVLVLAVFALSTFIGKTSEAKEQADAQLQAQTNDLLTTTNEKVIVPIFSKELKTGETYVFVLGMKNYLEQDANFIVNMEFSHALSGGQQREISIPVSKWIFEKQGPFMLKKDEKKIVALPVRAVDAFEDVTYVFNAYVTCDKNPLLCNPYGRKQVIEVHVVK